MIPTSEVLLIIASIQVFWSGYLTYKHKELNLKYDNLCENCTYTYTPKGEKKENVDRKKYLNI